MANASLSPKRALELMQRQRHAVIVLAMQRAKRSVQRQLQAQGLRLCEFTAKEITIRAEAYLADHRDELMASAMETVEQMTLEGFFGKRAQRDYFASANIASSEQKTEAWKSITSVVQNSCTEWSLK